MAENQSVKTSLGLEENVEAALCYVLGWVTGLIFILIEKDNKKIRFHAMQSLITFLGLWVVSFVLSMVLPMLGMLLSVLGIVLWILLMVKSFQGQMLKLPVVGDFAMNAIYKNETPPAQSPAASSLPAAPASAKKIFCSQCGKPATAQDRFCEQCGSAIQEPAASAVVTQAPSVGADREAILRAVEEGLGQNAALSVSRSQETDLEIKSVMADANWGVGKKRVEYSACLLAKEEERLVLYWEMIKESGSGMEATGGFKMEGFKVGKAISGTRKEIIIGPDGKKIVDYTWDYGKTRHAVEEIVKAQGWKFKTVLMKNKTRR